MAAPRLYQFEQRSGGRGAVIRIGPSGGKKTVAVYKDQRTAEYIVNQLNYHKHQEA